MQDWIQLVLRDTRQVQIQLKHKEWLDTSVFAKMKRDELCVPCVLLDEKEGILSYKMDDLLTLEEVLEQHSFEEQEGYYFLRQLFEDLIAANRNKTILMDPEYVFVGVYGDVFRFIALPIDSLDKPLEKEMLKKWIHFISARFKTKTAFELPGYLTTFLQADEFTLTNLLLGIEAIQKKYYPKKFSDVLKRKPKSFRVNEPMHRILEQAIVVNQEPLEINSAATMLLGQMNRSDAYLEINGQRYDLIHEVNLIGRSMACDIRLPYSDVSQKHAKITCQDLRYYITDLKSRNGTYLEGKKVIRRMRLKNGMKLRFASVEATFYQL